MSDDPVIKPDIAERLAASRRAIREAMMPRTAGADGQPEGTFIRWMQEIRNNPAAAVVVDAASDWWANHPWRTMVELLRETVTAGVGPIARRYPFRVLFGALIVGMLLTRVRPWRWFLRPALFAGLASQLLSRVLTHQPLQTWFATMASRMQRKTRRRKGRSNETPASAPGAERPQGEMNFGAGGPAAGDAEPGGARRQASG